MTRRYFAIEPGDPVQHFYETMAAMLSAQHPQIENLALRSRAHVTIVPPFEIEDVEAVLAAAENVVSQTRPITLSFGAIRSFADETLYLDVSATAQLAALRKLLLARLHDLFPEIAFSGTHEFRPHVSLARHLRGASFKNAVGFFAGEPEHHFPPTVADRFYLYAYDDATRRYEREHSFLFA